MSESTGRDQIPPERREEALERDGHMCKFCPAAGPKSGGTAQLEVHHADPDPDDDDRHALSNLVTLCEDCHRWHHKRPGTDDVPFRLTDTDDEVLDPTDYEILRYLAEHGPAGTSEVADALTAESSPTATRERLAALMGLDKQVDERNQQLVDQDVESGEWGLTEQIEQSARGHIPSDPQKLIQRMEDEQVRKALEQGCGRKTVMDVLDVSRRSTFHKQKRARAYDFPLDVLRRSGNGGQHPGSSPSSEEPDEIGEDDRTDAADEQSGGDDADEQRQAVLGDEITEDPEQNDSSVAENSAQPQEDGSDTSVDDGDVAVRKQLQTAIAVLQQISTEL